MGIALGLGAALSWGLADYFAAVAARRLGALRVVLGFHLAALVPLTVAVIATDALARISLGQVAVLAAIGVVGWASYLAFYGALAIGPISVISPIVSGYAAVTVLLAVVVGGNRLSVVETVAIAATIAGATLASADVREIGRPTLQRRSALGFALALAAMGLLGAFVFGVAYFRSGIGWLAPIFLARGFATVCVLGHFIAIREPRPRVGPSGLSSSRTPVSSAFVFPEKRSSPRRLIASLLLLAVLDTGGYVCFNLGVGHAETAIVAGASAPYAIVPIAMGVSLLGERPTRSQWLGVGFVIAGVVGLGAAG